jgi:hypothetical protein
MYRPGMIVYVERDNGTQIAFINSLDYPKVEVRFFDHSVKKVGRKVVDVSQVRQVFPNYQSLTKKAFYNLAIYVAIVFFIALGFEVIHNYSHAHESDLNQVCEKLGWFSSIFRTPSCFWQKPTFYKVIFVNI